MTRSHESGRAGEDPGAGSRDDLDLLAVRYVTGELDAAASDRFESRLAEDQTAREAVEFAVTVATLTVRQARASRRDVPPPVHRWWTGARIAAAAAVLLVTGLGYLLWGPAGAGSPGAARGSSPAQNAQAEASAAEHEAQDLIASWVAFGDPDEGLLADLGGDPRAAGEASAIDLEGEGDVVPLAIAALPEWVMQGLGN